MHHLPAHQQSPDSANAGATSSPRNLWVDYLRSTLTVLVVAHHAALAYTTFSVFDKVAYIRSTHAVVDKARWFGLDVFVMFNDAFFMSLMFLIGGFFLPASIRRKGAAAFVQDRIYRLLLPFLLGGTLLMLLAYFPSFYLATGQTHLPAYIKDFFTTQQWPVGPPWFLWVLFVFNVVFAVFYPVIRSCQAGAERLFSHLKNKPLLAWGVFFIFTALLYLPLTYLLGAHAWTGWGPFDFQVNRGVLYLGYFLLGTLIGSTDFNHTLFSEQAGLVRKWRIWTALALTVFAAFLWFTYSGVPTQWAVERKLPEVVIGMAHEVLFAACCTLISLAFMAVFRKFAIRPVAWWNSLSENAYLIYLLHFVFVTWMQFLLLRANISVFLKFILVFFVAFALSWLSSIGLRKFSLFRRYL